VYINEDIKSVSYACAPFRVLCISNLNF